MELPDIVKTILRSAAPTLLTALALPPPFNLIASAVVSGVLAKYLPEEEKPAGAEEGKPPVLTPAQISAIVEKKAADPQLVLDLKQAEADLRKYELESGIRFAEVEVADRKRAGDFQLSAGLSNDVFKSGIRIVWTAVGGMLLIVLGCLAMVLLGLQPKTDSSLTTAAFGLIGTAVGFVNGIAATIVAFYYGSSLGSKEKGDAIASSVASLGRELGQAANRPVAAPAAEPRKPGAAEPEADEKEKAARGAPDSAGEDDAAKPAALGLTGEVLPELTKPHRHFPGSVTWALARGGIAIDGAAPQGTPGDPATIGSIWARYGDICRAQARQYGVPVELIVATIAAESAGKPDARRQEPKIHDQSVGLMQTLVATARSALGRPSLRADDLLDPATSIAAGTAYICKQRGQTHFDPPLVAAAYNAGSLRREDAEANRWRTLCYPSKTGRHIDRWVAYFGDCMRLSEKNDWGEGGDVPSFAAQLLPRQEAA